jgi:hypothetical protein
MDLPIPRVDPIPLPAPVWIFQILHHLTLALHFSAVFLLVGGLGIAAALGLANALTAEKAARTAFGRLLVEKLPTVMAYVVNLGIPPLLFAQVLYGRALYTSSVLIGAFWISVVALVSASYFLLYLSSSRSHSGRPWTRSTVAAFGLVAAVAYIYSTNMSLMLRPETWLERYRAAPFGDRLLGGDPTVLPRWLLMLAGSFAFTGAALLLVARRAGVEPDLRRTVARTGGIVAVLASVLHVAFGLWAFSAEPSGVRDGFAANALGHGAGLAWIVLALASGVASLVVSRLESPPLALSAVPATLGFLGAAGLVLARSAVRDAALALAGFVVTDRAVEANWSVVGLFLLLFVVALGVVGWLISVVARARTPEPEGAHV